MKAGRAALLAAAVTALWAAWGLDARDLAGDEIHMLTGGPGEIAARAFDPRGGFVGHLPWSYWLRWAALSLFGDPAWAWRAHALVGAALAAGVSALAVGQRDGGGRGLAVGLLVGLSPVLSFHAQDASNYAWSAATGALVLGGLVGLVEGRRRAAAWLAAGLLVGGLNDVYFVFLGVTALLVSLGLLRRRAVRSAVLAAWAPAVVVLLPLGLLFAVRLLESSAGGVVDVHADPPAPTELPLAVDVTWRVLRRFGGAYLAGYPAGRIDAPWEVVAPVVLTGAALAAALRARKAEAAVLAGGLGLMLATGVVFRVFMERTFPHEPRAFLTLLPALAAVWVAGLARLPRPAAWAAGALLALSIGNETVLQAATRSTMHRDAARLAVAALPPGGQLVVPDRRVRARLPDGVTARSCLPAAPDAVPLVWVRLQPLDVPADRRACGADGAPDPTAPDVDLGHHRLAAAASIGPPEHERNAASFLMPAQVERWTPNVSDGPPSDVAPTWPGAALDGVSADSRVVTWARRGADWQEVHVGQGAPAPLLVHTEADAMRLVAWPAERSVPASGLFDPFRREVQATEPVQLGADGLLSPTLPPMVPLRAPAWQVLLRLVRIALAGLTLLAAAWPRRP